MKYLSVKEVAEKWNITERRVQHFCKDGKIHGAEKWGASWRIPNDAERPDDRRTREAKKTKRFYMPMPRKTPFLIMTDLYHTVGMADECADKLENHPEAQMLFRADIEYTRGNIDEVLEQARLILSLHTGFFAVLSGGMLLALCAVWKSDINLWKEAKQHICEAPCKDEKDREIVNLAIASVNSALHDITDFPDWFSYGNFDKFPVDALPAARVYYVKYLVISAKKHALKEKDFEDVTGLGLLRVIPFIVNPMISQVRADKTVVPEIYLRLLLATTYHYIGDDKSAVEQIDAALDIALPDRLLGILAEHRRSLDTVLDDRLKLRDVEMYKKYKELYKVYEQGWAKLHSIVCDKNISVTLSPREREAARLASFGLSNPEIAKRMNISLPSAKSLIFYAMNKTGAQSRSELVIYI